MQNSNTQLAILSGTVVSLGALVLLAVLFGTETAQLRMIQYLSSSAPAIIGYVFLANKQKATEDRTADTQEKVGSLAGSLNGKLDKRFSDLENRLSDQINANRVSVSPTATGELAIVTAPKEIPNHE